MLTRRTPTPILSRPVRVKQLRVLCTRASRTHAGSHHTGTLFRSVMSEEERCRLVSNIVGHLKHAKRSIQVSCGNGSSLLVCFVVDTRLMVWVPCHCVFVCPQERALVNFFRADPEYGRRVREGLATYWNRSKL